MGAYRACIDGRGVGYLAIMRGCPSATRAEINLALRHLRGRYRWRNRAMLVLGVHTGLRVSEILALRVGSVWSGAEILPRLYLDRRDSKGKRTGSSIVVHLRAAAALAKWIQSPLGPKERQAWLFPSQRCPGQPMRRHAAWFILHRAFIAAGVVGMCGSHVMRKSFCAAANRELRGDISGCPRPCGTRVRSRLWPICRSGKKRLPKPFCECERKTVGPPNRGTGIKPAIGRFGRQQRTRCQTAFRIPSVGIAKVIREKRLERGEKKLSQG
jgi:Phage integrase family